MRFFRRIAAFSRQAKIASLVVIYLEEAKDGDTRIDVDAITSEIYRFSYHIAPVMYSGDFEMEFSTNAMAASVLANGLLLSNLADNAPTVLSYRQTLDDAARQRVDDARHCIRLALGAALREWDTSEVEEEDERMLITNVREIYLEAS